MKTTHVGSVWVLQVKPGGLDWRSLNAEKDQTEVTVMAAWYSDKGKLLGYSGRS